MTSFRSSLFYVYTSKYSTFVIYFITTIILARILTPEDIGIYTVASVFIGLGQVLREFGINNYIIQEKDLTAERIRAAFTLNLLFGWGIALVMYFARTPIGNFYENEAVSDVISLLCINFLLVPIGAITYAHIRREMRFKHTMIIQITSTLVSAVVGVSAALAGESYRSLVWSAIAGTLTSVIMTLVFRPPGVLLLPGFREIPHVFTFCRYAGSSTLISHMGNRAPDLIIGKILDMSAVGIYGRAVGAISIFGKVIMEGLAGVMLPRFSKQHRDGGVDKNQYLTLSSSITALAWPFFAVLALLSEPVIYILFGKNWLESAPILSILCINAMLFYAISLVDQVLISTGRIRISFRLNVTIHTLNVTAILLSAHYGLIWVAVAVTCVSIIKLCIYQIVGQRVLDICFASFATIYRKSILLAIMTSIPSLAVILMGQHTSLNYLPNTFMLILATGLIWLASVWLLKLPLFDEIIKILFYIKNRYHLHGRS